MCQVQCHVVGGGGRKLRARICKGRCRCQTVAPTPPSCQWHSPQSLEYEGCHQLAWSSQGCWKSAQQAWQPHNTHPQVSNMCHRRTCRLLATVPTPGQRSSPLASAALAAASSRVCSCTRMGQTCDQVHTFQGGSAAHSPWSCNTTGETRNHVQACRGASAVLVGPYVPSQLLHWHPPAATGEQRRALLGHLAGQQLMAVQVRLQHQLSLPPPTLLQPIAVTAAGCRGPSPPAHTLQNMCEG